MLRLIPPVAAPVRVSQLAASLVHRRDASAPGFAALLARRSGMPRCTLFGSGRAALTAFLRGCALDGHDEVVLPAYTCWSVPASVVRAGLRVRLVDVDPYALGPDPDEVAAAIGSRTAAVIAAHLLGPSVDVAAVVRACRSRRPDVPIVEDAAQAWPEGGSVADAVLLSFGRGKPLALGSGGALCGREETDGPGTRRGGWIDAGALGATLLLSRPGWFRLPESVPALAIGETSYEPGFALDRPFHDWQETLGARLLPSLPALDALRSTNARRLAPYVESVSGWTVAAPGRAPGPLRLPVLAPDRARRDHVLAALRRRGVSGSAMYPGSIDRIPELRGQLFDERHDFPGARALAERLLTLPVYPFLRGADVVAIGEAFEHAAGRGDALQPAATSVERRP